MLEFDILVMPINANVQQALQAKANEGWMLVPGTVPTVVYQLCRQMQQQVPQGDGATADKKGFGVLNIDESKMHFIDKDGNKVERH